MVLPNNPPNPGQNRDLNDFRTAYLTFLGQAKAHPSAAGVAETVARDTYKNWVSENAESVLGKFDLAYLVRQKGFLGVLATGLQGLANMNDQARLILFNAIAAYIDQSNIGGPFVADTIAALFYALPKALPLMFNNPNPTLDHIQAELEKVAETTGFNEKMNERWWRFRGENTLIRKYGPKWSVPPADAKDGDVEIGDAIDMHRKYPHGPYDPAHFRQELDAGVIRVEVINKPAAPRKGRAFGHIADIQDPDKKLLIQALMIVVDLSIAEDPGLGLDKRAGHIDASLSLALSSKENAADLERITPKNRVAALELIRLSELTRTEVDAEKKAKMENKTPGESRDLLPLDVRLFITDLLRAYKVENPTPHAAVVARDFWDGLWDYAPSSLKPKRGSKTWIGLTAAVVVILGAIAATIFGALLYVAFSGSVSIWDGVQNIETLFKPYLDAVVFALNKSAATVWVCAVILVILDQFHPAVIAHNIKQAARTAEEQAKYKAPEPFRQKFLTIRLGAGAVGLMSILAGWQFGRVTYLGAALTIGAVWFLILLVDASLKWRLPELEAFRIRGFENTLKLFGASVVTLIALAILFSALYRPEDAGRVTEISTQVINNATESVAPGAKATPRPSAPQPFTREECELAVPELREAAKESGVTAEALCASSPSQPVCRCTELTASASNN